MEEFRQHLNQLYVTSQQLENVDIKYFIQEIELIGRQLKYSQEFLFKEIQRLKQDLTIHLTKFNHANELRDIDQNTLKTFKTKLQDLSQLLTDTRKKEINTYHLVQILRVNTSRLWHIFESATGSTITQEIIYEDLQKLLQQSQIENDEQTSYLNLLEIEHANLLLKLKEIQLSLENFRTKILQITENMNKMKIQIQNQQQTNDHIYEQTSNKINQFIFYTKDIQIILHDYKSLVYEINHLLKLIFHIQTQIEIHHKSILIYQIKLEKYKQDLTLIILHRTNYENQTMDLKKQIQQQNQNLQKLDNQQTKILHNRKQLHQQIHRFDQNKIQILNHQQQLLEEIKQTTIKNQFLNKQIFQSNQILKNLNFSHQKLIQEQNKQQNITNQLHSTIEINERQLQLKKIEINQLTNQINEQNQQINIAENRIELHTNELNDLEICLSTTHEERVNHRTKVNESKMKVKSLKQKMHKLITDEKPLTKEILHYQKQIIQNQINHSQLEFNFKQNEIKINQYNTIIEKLIRDSNEDNRILIQENLLLQQYQHQTEKSKENIKKLNKDFKYFEDNYQNLKELSYHTDNENRQLKQQYVDLTFVVQLLSQRQVILNNQLKPLYDKLQYLTKYHQNKVQMIEQSKLDLDILNRYYHQLQLHHYQLCQSLSFTSQQNYEYLHCQSFSNQLDLEIKNNSNHIHYWQTLMINSPEKFDKISKLLLIKKKLVNKSNELLNLKQIFHQKNTLYRYLNEISKRRQRLIEKIEISNVLNNNQLNKQKKITESNAIR